MGSSSIVGGFGQECILYFKIQASDWPTAFCAHAPRFNMKSSDSTCDVIRYGARVRGLGLARVTRHVPEYSRMF